jgi:ribosomal protein S13
MSEIVAKINRALRYSRVVQLRDLAYKFNDEEYMADPGEKVQGMLSDMCMALDRDLVVFFDEADCLQESPLIKFLGQVRDGYLERSQLSSCAKFPRAMALVGMRDIRDYLTKVRPENASQGPGGSPFNVKSLKPLTLTDFTRGEIIALYGQHTGETGQVFDYGAIDRAWYWSEGQPWLVNALANYVIYEQFKSDYSKTVTGADIDLAARSLILINPTHYDSLMERLREPRVRRVMDAVIAGEKRFPRGVSSDDKGYVIDLGLLKAQIVNGITSLRPSNATYRELIIRFLTRDIQDDIPEEFQNKWMDGTSLDMDSLLKAFQLYWRENSKAQATKIKTINSDVKDLADNLLKVQESKVTNEIRAEFIEKVNYLITDISGEAYAHLVLFAFLQRVLNGGADVIQREYALGLTRADICVSYKGIRYPLELKIKGAMTREQSIKQILGYMDTCGSSVGWLIVFDKDTKKLWEEKIFWETKELDGKIIHVVGC